LVGESEHNLFVLRGVVQDEVIDVQTLLSERNGKLIADQASVEIFFDYAESVFGVGEVEERGGCGVESEAETTGLSDVFTVHWDII
jgi:hypothetical protein